MDDGSWTGTVSLTKDVWTLTPAPATNAAESIAATVSMVSPGLLKVIPDVVDPVVTFAENTNYTLTISGVPTPEEEINLAMGSFVIGLGKTATGGCGSSSG